MLQLLVVLLVPEGMGSLVAMLREKLRPTSITKQVVTPDLARLSAAIRDTPPR